MIFFSNLKKYTSPANEFLLHKCRNKNKKIIFFSKLKKITSPANEFLLHNRNNSKMIFFFSKLKNVQVQLMRFYYINVETIGK